MNQNLPKPIEPIFITSTPDSPVTLLDEHAEVLPWTDQEKLQGIGQLKITQHWSPMRHVFEFKGELIDLDESIEHEADVFSEKNWSYFGDSIKIIGRNFRTIGFVDCGDDFLEGEIEDEALEIGTDHKLNRAIFHLPNYPNPSGGQSIDSDEHEYRAYHLSEIRLEAQGWRIRIQPLKNFQQLEWAADEKYGSVINAVGEITKQELIPFKPRDLKQLLESLHFFLSFTFCEWTPPLFVVGSNDVKERSWQYFKNHDIRRVRYGGLKGWLSIRGGDQLSSAFQGFTKKWSDPNWREPLKSAIKWLVESSVLKDRDILGAITFAQIPLEMLAWMVFVDEEEIINENEFDKLSAASKIQLLLSRCQIDFSIDSDPVLKEISNNSKFNTGPKLITKVRNTIIHPNKSNRELLDTWANKHGIPVFKIYSRTFELFEHYLLLVMLYLLGYGGEYRDRLTRSIFSSSTRVPWADKGGEA
ncbi:hypothetical protein [Roseiconus lacunae]|uniref:hypothetical protein n=1 Tax=Roseiconus lacunae TaxID=2605694 RepID=UPI001E33630F|nr:hypothetical protein [Roseiconus lacunae]MCD0458647.1 hypothetical protein [Roseiconus lacunae]